MWNAKGQGEIWMRSTKNMQKQMLLHYFLGKLEAKLCLMSKYEENIENQKLVLDKTCENEEGVARDRRMAKPRQ